MSSIIQKAFLLEACANVPGIYVLLCQPKLFLQLFLAEPVTSIGLNQTTIFFTRVIGALVLALTPQLLFAFPDRLGVADQRKMAYLTLGSGEIILIPLFLLEAFRATDAEKAMSSGGLSRGMALMSVAAVAVPLMWRVFVWTMRPHWFAGNRTESRKTD